MPAVGRATDYFPTTSEGGYLVYSSRAGGVYVLEAEWAQMASRDRPIAPLSRAPSRQKATLSHWIYRQNLKPDC